MQLTKNTQGDLQLSVKDNGVGMDVEAVDQTKHFGLLGMRERAQALRGIFKVDSTLKVGTAIYINIPYQPLNH